MADHSTLAFNTLHKAKIDSGLLANLPASPEGDGDMYYATDTGVVYIGVSSAWVQLSAPSSESAVTVNMYQSSYRTKTKWHETRMKLTVTNDSIYTVPANTATTINSINITNKSGGAGNIRIYLNNGASDVRILYADGVANNEQILLEVPIVMTTGDILKVESSVQPVHYSITGHDIDTSAVTEIVPVRYAGIKTTTSTDTLATVASGKELIVTGIVLSNATGGADSAYVYDNETGTGTVRIVLLDATSMSDGDVVYLSGQEQVLDATDKLDIGGNAVSGIHYIVSGYIKNS